MALKKMLFGAAFIGGAGYLSICDLCKPAARAAPASVVTPAADTVTAKTVTVVYMPCCRSGSAASGSG